MTTVDFQDHPDPDVNRALIRLCDALCTWERATGRESILIVKEVGGFKFRADCGKPLPSSNDDIPDQQLLDNIDIRAAEQGY